MRPQEVNNTCMLTTENVAPRLRGDAAYAGAANTDSSTTVCFTNGDMTTPGVYRSTGRKRSHAVLQGRHTLLREDVSAWTFYWGIDRFTFETCRTCGGIVNGPWSVCTTRCYRSFHRKLDVTSLFVCQSSLNGSCGEFTGSDDLDRNDKAKRDNKSAKLRLQHQKTVENRSDPDDMSERSPGSKTSSVSSRDKKAQVGVAGTVKSDKIAANIAADVNHMSMDQLKKALAQCEANLKDVVATHEGDGEVDDSDEVKTSKINTKIKLIKAERELYKTEGVDPPHVADYALQCCKLYMCVEESVFAKAPWFWGLALGVISLTSLLCLHPAMGGGGKFIDNANLTYDFWVKRFNEHPDEYESVRVNELYSRADPADNDFRPIKKYGFNAVRVAQYCPGAVKVLAKQHPGLRPTAYTQSTFEYTLSTAYPNLDQAVRRDTATFYHQRLLIDEALRNSTMGNLRGTFERI